jgi:peptidoglycan/LPS O-acetylase OafA/YrhL
VEPEALEDDGHYEPPPPPKIPRPRPRTIGAVLMIVLGFAAIFAPFAIGLDDSGLSLLFGLVLTVGGAAVLVFSMRDAPPTDSGPDDGAVV